MTQVSYLFSLKENNRYYINDEIGQKYFNWEIVIINIWGMGRESHKMKKEKRFSEKEEGEEEEEVD